MDKNNIIKSIKAGLQKKGIINQLDGYKLFLFGSRSKNTEKKKSDIDIGILGKTEIPSTTFFQIEEVLEELPTLLKFDLVDFNNTTEDFQSEALKTMDIIYE